MAVIVVVAALAREPQVLRELAELTDILESQRRIGDRVLPGLADLPLVLHGHYQIREILTAVGWLTAEKRTPFQAGVLALADRTTELLFVTLDKSEGYHDRIAYHDYAVSPTEFHWQTQNSAGPDTKAGKRYMESRTNGWRFQLFVRATPSAPYTACGPVSITSANSVSHQIRAGIPPIEPDATSAAATSRSSSATLHARGVRSGSLSGRTVGPPRTGRSRSRHQRQSAARHCIDPLR